MAERTNFTKRVGLFPDAHTLDQADANTLRLAGPQRFLTRTYAGGRAQGPVVAVHPTVDGLAQVSRYAIDGVLVVIEFGFTPELVGWATAVQAYNARTDAETPPLSADLHAQFTSMLMWETEIGQGAARGAGRGRVQGPLRIMKSEGLSEEFVIGYSLALGLSSHYFPKLSAHYRAAD
ncbi:hypothetical protein [Rhodococcus sp. KB6]|uniref:hypothetical protein n=1 Tax=Rhodococcus sp. KB6 TaxID=1752066 RepID=UPI000AC9C2AD|nr:hypothetical protein [Rhodococcus sp. KB6]